MFTGIVEEKGSIVRVAGGLTVAADCVLQGVKAGDSIAVNGVCLTVTTFNQQSFAVSVMPETLRRTNLGSLKSGDAVNLERAMALGGRMGGHLVQGHIDATGTVAGITKEKEAVLVEIKAPPAVMRFVVEKGFMAVDGISLTIMACGSSSFKVSIVDYTYNNTNLKGRKIGDAVNLEVDIIAKYVERLTKTGKQPITENFLMEHGFTTLA